MAASHAGRLVRGISRGQHQDVEGEAQPNMNAKLKNQLCTMLECAPEDLDLDDLQEIRETLELARSGESSDVFDLVHEYHFTLHEMQCGGFIEVGGGEEQPGDVTPEGLELLRVIRAVLRRKRP